MVEGFKVKVAVCFKVLLFEMSENILARITVLVSFYFITPFEHCNLQKYIQWNPDHLQVVKMWS